MKTAELTGTALDWAVAKCENRPEYLIIAGGLTVANSVPQYSTDWAQGGPIIEREKIELARFMGRWVATRAEGHVVFEVHDPTPLIAAMRCYVASRLGDEVEVPDELQNK